MFASYGYPQRHYASGPSIGDLFGHPSCRSPYADPRQEYAYEVRRRQQAEELRKRRELEAREAYLQEMTEREAYQNALAEQQERQRRLAAEQQRARQAAAAAADMVTVQLSDGRRYLVPRSWYEQQLRRQDREPEASVKRAPLPPAHRSSSPSESVDNPISAPAQPAQPVQRTSTPEEREEAAIKIQTFARRLLRLNRLRAIESRFTSLRSTFAPSPSSLVFATSSTPSSLTSDVPRLAFNVPANRPVQEYEEALLKLLTDCDKVESVGSAKVKGVRKAIVAAVEQELARLDTLKAHAWTERCVEARKAREENVGEVTGDYEASVLALADESTILQEHSNAKEHDRGTAATVSAPSDIITALPATETSLPLAAVTQDTMDTDVGEWEPVDDDESTEGEATPRLLDGLLLEAGEGEMDQ